MIPRAFRVEGGCIHQSQCHLFTNLSVTVDSDGGVFTNFRMPRIDLRLVDIYEYHPRPAPGHGPVDHLRDE